MPSTEITTTTQPLSVGTAPTIARAGNRLYWVGADLTDLVYLYSDNDGATWTGRTVLHADETMRVSAVYDAVNGRMNFAYSGGNSNLLGLKLRAITSNVTSGTPGALTSETVIDADGADVGVQYPQIIHSATGTNPRYWIIAQKWTTASTIETRVWFCAAGSAADTAGNWSTTNFTNLGANASEFGHHMGLGTWWTVGGADKVTFVFMNDVSGNYESVTFDPTAATPTPGSITAVAADFRLFDYSVNGLPVALASRADYLVFGSLDTDNGTWDFFKTVNGTAWSTPTGWADLTMGRASLSKSGTDFYILYGTSFGAVGSTAVPLAYRKISTASDAMGGGAVFSDTNGNTVTSLIDTGVTSLYGIYRGSTASPYTVRFDVIVFPTGFSRARLMTSRSTSW